VNRRPTLARHLLAWALGALVAVWAVFIAVGYLTGQEEADELTDGHLASVSALVAGISAPEVALAERPRREAQPGMKAHDYQQSLSVVVWDGAGQLLVRIGDAPAPRFQDVEDGFSMLQLGAPPQQAWRAFTRWNPTKNRRIAVLISGQDRDDLADDISHQIVQPGLWILPVIALALGLAVWRGLQPLRDLGQQVHALDVQERVTLVEPRHQELAEAVQSINLLVARYHDALTRERALASELAHELRTPLAALMLQAGSMRSAPDLAAQEAAVAAIEREVRRADAVLHHILSLARASRADLDGLTQGVDVTELARSVVAEYGPAAHAGGRELGFSEHGRLKLQGHPPLLEIMLRNLVENALNHTPAGSEVEVSVDAERRVLRVCDRPALPGPSAPAHEVKQSPRRHLGWGLGHRVVEKVADVHGADFRGPFSADDWVRCYEVAFRTDRDPSRA
jgi:two-component system sensor histidine kinase QseC